MSNEIENNIERFEDQPDSLAPKQGEELTNEEILPQPLHRATLDWLKEVADNAVNPHVGATAMQILHAAQVRQKKDRA